MIWHFWGNNTSRRTPSLLIYRFRICDAEPQRTAGKIAARLLRCVIAPGVLVFIACSGGFLDDNGNAAEFTNPIFYPEKVTPDTSQCTAVF